MKIACVYLTNKNSNCIFNLINLQNHIVKYNNSNLNNITIDLFIYNNNESIDDIIYNDNYCEFAYKQLQNKLNYCHWGNWYRDMYYVGQTFLVLFDLYLKYSEYNKFIFYEDDVSYIGNNNIFNLFDFNSDVIFPYTRVLNYNWVWYKYNNFGNLQLDPYSGLLNIYMLSKDIIKNIYNFIQDGNYGHFEYIVNSFIMVNYKQNNWKISYLNGNNEFKEQQKYLNYNGSDFIHPIKSINELKIYINKSNN